MKNFLHFLIIVAVSCKTIYAQTPDANGIIYVKPNGAGNHSGTSWNNAIAEVADALIAAKTLNTALAGTVKEIWIASGTYKPLYKAAVLDNAGIPTIDKDKAFVLVPNVKLYGGFAGNETSLASRDISNTNVYSVLSGDIGVAGSDLDNVYHVVISAGDVGTAEVNGFVVTKGYADFNGDISSIQVLINVNQVNRINGAGIYCSNSSPSFNNTIISNNQSITAGGGLALQNSSPTLNFVVINNNRSHDGAGAYITSNSSPSFTNVTISNNIASASGGGISLSSATLFPVSFTNVFFSNNSAFVLGGGMVHFESLLNINNSTFEENTASFGGGLYTSGTSTSINNAFFKGNTGNFNGAGISIGYPSSTNINNVLISGNNGVGIYTSSTGTILTNVTISGNLGRGLENSQASTKIRNSIIYGNNSEILNYGGSTPEFTNSLIKGSGGSGNWNSAYGTNLGNNKDGDPLFVSPIPSNNTAATTAGDFRLKLASPAVDAGNNSFNTLTTDLDGASRIFRNIIDMGAYENHDGALPVTLKSFNAEKTESSIRLFWETTAETNSEIFEIQRSADGKDFEAIGTITAKGESTEFLTYSFMDYLFPADVPTLYYRLKMVDKDNSYAYSTIKSVKINDAALSAGTSLYPNPVSGSISNQKVILKINGLSGQTPIITFSDIKGRSLPVKTEYHPVSSQAELNISGFKPGIYFVSIRIGDKVAVKKLVIE